MRAGSGIPDRPHLRKKGFEDFPKKRSRGPDREGTLKCYINKNPPPPISSPPLLFYFYSLFQ